MEFNWKFAIIAVVVIAVGVLAASYADRKINETKAPKA